MAVILIALPLSMLWHSGIAGLLLELEDDDDDDDNEDRIPLILKVGNGETDSSMSKLR